MEHGAHHAPRTTHHHCHHSPGSQCLRRVSPLVSRRLPSSPPFFFFLPLSPHSFTETEKSKSKNVQRRAKHGLWLRVSGCLLSMGTALAYCRKDFHEWAALQAASCLFQRLRMKLFISFFFNPKAPQSLPPLLLRMPALPLSRPSTTYSSLPREGAAVSPRYSVLPSGPRAGPLFPCAACGPPGSPRRGACTRARTPRPSRYLRCRCSRRCTRRSCRVEAHRWI